MGTVEMRDLSRGAVTCDSFVLSQQEGRQALARLEAAREALKSAHQALDDLAEEARRAGALPGWLR